MKIKIQFISGMIIIVFLMVAAFTYTVVKKTEDYLYNEINEKGKLVLNYLQGVTLDPLLKKDKLSLITYIQKVGQTQGILFIHIADNKGIIVASTNKNDIDRKLYPIIKNQGEIQKIKYDERDYYSINFFDNILVKSKGNDILVGTIIVGFDKNYIDNKLNQVYMRNLTIAFFCIFIGTLLIIMLTNRILNPLNELIKGTEILAEGNLRHKIKVNVRNEFQILANSFNEMSEKLFNYYEGILNAFIIAIDTKDKYTPGHSKRVAKYATEIAKEMKLDQQRIENIRIASILKDVGNIGVERGILHKKEILSPDDMIEIQKHPETSARILGHIEALKGVIPIILQHHERYDGNGYPKGLKGNEILLEARILSIADAYDAMVTERQHRKALSVEEAVYELRTNKGKQFDPEIVEIFIKILNKKGDV